MSKQLRQFLTISNKIEGVVDEREVDIALWCLEGEFDWITYHKQMSYLNSYCKAGVYRDYPVYIGGRKGIPSPLIKGALAALFTETPKNWTDVQHWHVRFEHIHPFGDGNGRVGRYIMAQQAKKARCLGEMYESFGGSPFEEMRRSYYNWF